jgi:hypothetical protein
VVAPKEEKEEGETPTEEDKDKEKKKPDLKKRVTTQQPTQT